MLSLQIELLLVSFCCRVTIILFGVGGSFQGRRKSYLGLVPCPKAYPEVIGAFTIARAGDVFGSQSLVVTRRVNGW
jgi:hypothetical protein